MKIIPVEIIHSVQNQLDRMKPEYSQQEIQKVYSEQPNILEYIVAVTEELGDELSKHTFYLFSVIYLAVRNVHPKKIEKIGDKKIIKVHDDNIDMMERLEGAHEVFFDRFAETSILKQPGIFEFISRSLFEEISELSEVNDDDIGWMFLVLKSAVDVLDSHIQ